MTNDKDMLGSRMKVYESTYSSVLPPRQPTVIRVDGKAFHTYTRGLKRPYSTALIDAMNQVAIALCSQVQTTVMAYVQSDEISLLLHPYPRYETQPWFKGKVQKMVSVSAAIASTTMTVESPKVFGQVKPALFDSRVMVLPTPAETHNYFLWRQQDAIRNSIQMLAQAKYPPKHLHGVSCDRLKVMLFTDGIDWNKEPVAFKQGRVVLKTPNDAGRSEWVVYDAPAFKEDPHFVVDLLQVEDQ